MRIPRRTQRELIDEDSDPISLYERKELRELLDRALLSVSKRERYIIRHRYGFGVREMTIGEISEKIKLSKTRIRIIEKRAFEKIIGNFPRLGALRDRSPKIMRSGRFRLNERVQVIQGNFDFTGFGTIVGFRKIFFSFPDLYPEIKLENGKTICDHRLRIIKERDSLRIARRIMSDLFSKEK